jgi:type III secretion protein R
MLRQSNLLKGAFLLLFVFFLSPFSLFSAEAAPQLNSQPLDLPTPAIVIQMGVLAGLSLLPFAVMMLSSYMKVVIVLSLLRNALGVQQAPPNQILNGIAIIITCYVMFPTGAAMFKAGEDTIKTKAPTELFSGATAEYIVEILSGAQEPFREFLVRNTSPKHMTSFYKLAYKSMPDGYRSDLKPTSFMVLMPAYITSQLKAAFEVGVLVYLPFFVIDLVTSNILLAMGMMMLSPLTIALPLKLLLIVMIDGWTLVIQGLILSFR